MNEVIYVSDFTDDEVDSEDEYMTYMDIDQREYAMNIRNNTLNFERFKKALNSKDLFEVEAAISRFNGVNESIFFGSECTSMLHEAISRGYLEVVKLVVKMTKRIFYYSSGLDCPVLHAVKCGQLDIFKYLYLLWGGDAHDCSYWAAKLHQIEMLEFMFRQENFCSESTYSYCNREIKSLIRTIDRKGRRISSDYVAEKVPYYTLMKTLEKFKWNQPIKSEWFLTEVDKQMNDPLRVNFEIPYYNNTTNTF